MGQEPEQTKGSGEPPTVEAAVAAWTADLNAFIGAFRPIGDQAALQAAWENVTRDALRRETKGERRTR